jgi:hypothetical protein
MVSVVTATVETEAWFHTCPHHAIRTSTGRSKTWTRQMVSLGGQAQQPYQLLLRMHAHDQETDWCRHHHTHMRAARMHLASIQAASHGTSQ